MRRPTGSIRLVVLVVVVVAVGMAISEAAMQPTGRDRAILGAIFGGAGLLTLVMHRLARRLSRRLSSLAAVILLVSVSAVVAATITVLLAAGSMFLSVHDRNLVLVALGLGVGLALAASVTVSEAVTEDLRLVVEAAERLAGGELSARARLSRKDEIGELGEAFDGMAVKLQAAETERTALFQAVGHDLRTPLASIRAAVEAIQDGLAPDRDAYLAGVVKDVEHLDGLVSDVFALARLEGGSFELRPEWVDMAELADDAAESLTPLARTREVGLRVTTEGAAPALVDPTAFSRVIRNLLENALRHSPPGSTVTIEVGAGSLRVVDEGDGFPADFATRAFDRFTRADPARSAPGSGLGLAIARGIVEASGGTIFIEPGVGGRVTVKLQPAGERQSDDQRRQVPANRSARE
jgi:two-component system, OmpR family, sensor histidine kinase BaeS